jgi:hypothetical protein
MAGDMVAGGRWLAAEGPAGGARNARPLGGTGAGLRFPYSQKILTRFLADDMPVCR